MIHPLRFLFYAAVVRPVVLVALGLNVRHRERLPLRGPAIIAANHNSHLDALVLMTLFPLRLLPRLRPVGAADYFFRQRLLRWFATNVVGIIPVERSPRASGGDPLAGCCEALERGDIVFFFPEGSRGTPEQLAAIKPGIAHLAQRFPDVPIVPVYMHGLGKALPRGEAVFVPFFCDVFIGESMRWAGNRSEFLAAVEERLLALKGEGRFPEWQ